MKIEDKNKAAAKLDGQEPNFSFAPPSYVTYDTLIPLIQKWFYGSAERMREFGMQLALIQGNYANYQVNDTFWLRSVVISATPENLLEALLKAAREWHD